MQMNNFKNLVETAYKNPRPEEQWHQRMLAGKDFLPCFVEKTPLDSQGQYGFTPLHIAAIMGNREGVQFLLDKKVNAAVKDSFGHIALDYAKELHPELLDLFTYPHQISFDLDPIIGPILERWLPDISTSSNPYQAYTDDFGVEIEELLLSKEIDERRLNERESVLAKKRIWSGITFLHTPKNFEKVAGYLGIKLKRASEFYYVRDHYFWKGEEVVTAHQSPHLAEAIERTHSSNLYLDKISTTRTKNQLFNKWSGYTEALQFLTLEDQKNLFLQPKPLNYAYLEGGNVFRVTDFSGNLKVLIGEDQLSQTLLTLELEGTSWEKLAEEISSFSELVEREIPTLALAEEIYSNGLLTVDGKSGLIERSLQLNFLLLKFLSGSAPITPKERGWLKKLAEEMGVLKPFDPEWLEKEDVKKAVKEYGAKKKIVHRLIAKELGVKGEDLFPIAQVNSHLDTFLRPGPNHTVFLVNYALLAELLEAIDRSRQALKLSLEDQEQLLMYLKTAKKLDLELSPLIKEAEEQLIKAGFKVIPTPGHLVHEPKTIYQEFPMPSEGFTINFINSLTGWSSKTKSYFYITHGLQAGTKLGDLLMDLFTLFLKKCLKAPIDLFFIGRNPENFSDFAEALDAWNRLETQYGIHCHTFELKARSKAC